MSFLYGPNIDTKTFRRSFMPFEHFQIFLGKVSSWTSEESRFVDPYLVLVASE